MPIGSSSRLGALLFVFFSTTPFISVWACQHLSRRQNSPSTWQAAAQSLDPLIECRPYGYPPVQAIVKNYPVVWEIANLSQPSIDPSVVQLYQQFAPRIPSIQVKGNPQGEVNATLASYSRSDPDCWWTFNKCTTPKLSGLSPDISSCPEPSTYGLTIDDGPNCSHNAYYELLRKTNQKATLFYVGSNVIDWPLEAQRGLGEGHEVCAHTWSHRHMTGLTNEQAFAELYYSKKIIKDLLGVTVKCWRPPFGDVDDRIRFIALSLGMTTILWDYDVNDFSFVTLGQAAVNAKYDQLIDAASKGAFSTHGTLVLSHELNRDTMDTNAAFLPKLSQAFKYITPVAVCQNNTRPYVETGYTYPTFSEWVSGTRVKQITEPTANPSPRANLSSPIETGSLNSNQQLQPAYSGEGAAAARSSGKACLLEPHFVLILAGLVAAIFPWATFNRF